ncbi:hypothetical protein Ac2012v2_005796 [Leucoagaricus gongylophorus]
MPSAAPADSHSAALARLSLLAPPTLTVIHPTPEVSPVTPSPRKVSPLDVSQAQKTRSSGSGKRKAEGLPDPEGNNSTPLKEYRATFAPDPRMHRSSSSYHRKRARLSVPSDSFNPSSRPPSTNASLGLVRESSDVKTTGSWSSKRSGKSAAETLRRAASSSTHAHARNDLVARSHSHIGSTPPSNTLYLQQTAVLSRPSLSQMSLPISALISPHAPSVTYSGKYHMRDPRKPAPIQSTPWSLSFPSRIENDQNRWERTSWAERGGSPLCAWLFFIGFLVFPVWWATWLVGVPQTRRLVDDIVAEREKAVVLDDPQVEYDARTWRRRCRIMSGVSLVTYIPFIILVIVFAR